MFLVISCGIRSFDRRLLILLAGQIAACSSGGEPVTVAGQVQDPGIREASGLAASGLDPGRLWVLNDGGSSASVHAIGRDGRPLGVLAIDGAENHDWEDLAAFETGGRAWLLIADVGDNAATRAHVTLYVVPEPASLSGSVGATPTATISLRFPDGPRDVEAVAVDADERQVYLLTKRTLPPELYVLPLVLEGGRDAVTAEYLGPVTGLPGPSARDVRRAPQTGDWYWQPTAMDFSADAARAVVLTYEAVYVFERGPGENWRDALNGKPARKHLGGIREAEGAAIAGDTIFVTVEAAHPPLYRIEFPRD
ncbi:MAG: hypothetical protein OEW35_07450 [Gammaproteobacteria bacterium]|nr:hypothetical protein [Gammaproteobacteria bacterium]